MVDSLPNVIWFYGSDDWLDNLATGPGNSLDYRDWFKLCYNINTMAGGKKLGSDRNKRAIMGNDNYVHRINFINREICRQK